MHYGHFQLMYGTFNMAIVLAIVILGWLVAFALGAQEGFENESTVVSVQASTATSVKSESSNAPTKTFSDTISAA